MSINSSGERKVVDIDRFSNLEVSIKLRKSNESPELNSFAARENPEIDVESLSTEEVEIELSKMNKSPEELSDSETFANELDSFNLNESKFCSSTPARRFSTRVTRGIKPKRLTYE